MYDGTVDVACKHMVAVQVAEVLGFIAGVEGMIVKVSYRWRHREMQSGGNCDG